MGRLRYGYLADLIACLLLSLVVGATVCSFSRLLFLKEIPGGNMVELEYSLLKHPGAMLISRYDEDGVQVTTDNISVPEVKTRLSHTADIPFIHSHRIAFSFTPDDNLVAVYRMRVNGEEIDLRDISKVFRISPGMGAAYSDEMRALIIHSRRTQNSMEFAPGFTRIIRLTRQELSDLKRTEVVVNAAYLLLCCGGSFLFFFFLMNHCKKQKCMFLFYALFFPTALLSFDMAFVKLTENYLLNLNDADAAGNMLKLQQNYLPLLFIGLILPLIASCQMRRLWQSALLLLPPCALIVLLLLDSFAICNIDSRFMFVQIDRSDFFQHYRYLMPFVIKYLKSPGGWFMYMGIILFVICCVISFRRLAMKDRFTLIAALAVAVIMTGFAFYPLKYEYNDHKFSNVFQINNFTTNKLGNYQRDYHSSYPPRDNLDFDWELRRGENNQRSVIVLFVSSLDCSMTFVCGLEDNFMPNLERIAGENLVFDNYYSNNFNSLGSYITFLKGLPYFPPRSFGGSSRFATQLYGRDDLLDDFRKYGYRTAFFSGSDLLFGLEEEVAAGGYDHVHTDRSEEFDRISRRYVFNSVPDGDLLRSVADRAREEQGRFLYVVRTASSHSPYSTPWGDYNFEQSFRYTDSQIGLFVQRLESDGFFEKGILIITGDHRAVDNPMNPLRHSGVMVQNRVPLVLIDGSHQQRFNHVFFSHSSLRILLESLELPVYEVNRFHADPLHRPEPEIIFHYEFERKNFVIVKIGEEEAEIKLLGEDTVFQQHIFPAAVEEAVLGYLAWCRP